MSHSDKEATSKAMCVEDDQVDGQGKLIDSLNHLVEENHFHINMPPLLKTTKVNYMKKEGNDLH
jgi:hypothetical protein